MQAVAHCAARHRHLEWASNDEGGEPDVVMACCGDVPTLETLAAVSICCASICRISKSASSTSST